MPPADNVIRACLYVPDKRPLLIFKEEAQARQFKESFAGAEIYGDKTHVFLPTPHGLELVLSSHQGEIAFLFHNSHQAQDWFQRLSGYGTMYSGGENPTRTVFLGKQGTSYDGVPIWPGVA